MSQSPKLRKQSRALCLTAVLISLSMGLNIWPVHVFQRAEAAEKSVAQKEQEQYEQDGFARITSTKLSQIWAKHPAVTENKSIVLKFQLLADGSIKEAHQADSVLVYNSCGDASLDQYAIKSLKEAAPFKLTEAQLATVKERNYQCLAKFNTDGDSAFFSGQYALNYDLYLAAVQRQLQKVWTPTEITLEPIVCTMTINSTGSLGHTDLTAANINAGSAQDAIEAVSKAAPFQPLSPGSPDKITVKFTFPTASETSTGFVATAWTPLTLDTPTLRPQPIADDLVKQKYRVPKTNDPTGEELVVSETPIQQENSHPARSADNTHSLPTADSKTLDKITSAQLSHRWSKNNAGSSYKNILVEFKMLDSGELEPSQIKGGVVTPQTKIFRSSGNTALDDEAMKEVRECAPYTLTPSQVNSLKKTAGKCLAKFDTKDETVFIVAKPEPDFAGYMADLQRTIKRAWFIPTGSPSSQVRCAFTVDVDGVISHLKILKVKLTGNDAEKESNKPDPLLIDALEKSAFKAISNVSPVHPLPEWTPATVDVEFTFQCNARGGRFNEGEQGHFVAKSSSATLSVPPVYIKDYLESAVTKIQMIWKIPKGAEAISEKVSFDIKRDGSIENLLLNIVTGDNEADRAVLKAVESAAPFGSLPKEAGDRYRATITLKPGF